VKLACVYLARANEGFGAIRTFLASYDRHEAGTPHTLIVIYKGWKPDQLPAAKALFAHHPHLAMELPDEGFDIGPYLLAARAHDFDYMCFCNSFAEIMADGWLDKLAAAATRPGVGMVSASGSFESLRDTSRYQDFLIHAYRNGLKGQRNELIGPLYYYIVDRKPRGALDHAATVVAKLWLPRLVHLAGFSVDAETFVARRRAEGGSRHWTLAYPPFPNPHLRSNAFMIKRSVLAESRFAPPRNKHEALAFESGADGLSAQLRGAGLELLIIGADGTAYGPEQWPASRTFRSGDQENLLVGDNQTRGFTRLSPLGRVALQFITWGHGMQDPLPEGFPSFGMPFAVTGLDRPA